jgi:hypothetical protein
MKIPSVTRFTGNTLTEHLALAIAGALRCWSGTVPQDCRQFCRQRSGIVDEQSRANVAQLARNRH